jgi:pheromone a factor receptor
VVPSPEQQRLKRAIEIFLCIILPCFVMAAHYLVQPTRYDLRILAGCTPSFDNSWPSVLLVFIWPALVCVIASVYCAVSLVRLWKHRQQMSSVLSSTPGLSQARFTRLFVFASVLLLCYLPLALVAFAENLMIHLHIYSWSYIHPPDWASTISLVRPKNITFDRWAQVFTAYVLFGFYGWGDEARQTYLSALHGVRSAIAKCFEWLGLPQLQRAGTTRSVSARPSRTIEDQTSVLRMREMPHRVEATDAADRC